MERLSTVVECSGRPGSGTHPLEVLVVGSSNSVHVTTRAEALARAGAAVTVVSGECPREKSDLYRVICPAPPASSRGTIKTLQWIDSLSKLIMDTTADVIYVHYASGHLAWLAAMDRRPMAVSVMGDDLLPKGEGRRTCFSRWLTRHLLRQAELVTVKSPFLGGLVAKCGVQSEAIMEVLWGVDPTRFENVQGDTLREELKIPVGAQVVFSPRMMRPRFHIDAIIDAIPVVLNKVSNAFFVFAEHNAHPPYQQQLRERLKALGILGSVRFVGEINSARMPEYFALARVTVSLHDRDGFPQSVLESMAARTPCVVGKIPDLEGTVEHDREVWFVDFEKTSIGYGIAMLLDDDVARQRLISNGTRFVAARADLNRDAARVYERLQCVAKVPARPRMRIRVVLAIVLDAIVGRYKRWRAGSKSTSVGAFE